MGIVKQFQICGPMDGLPNNNHAAFFELEKKLENDYLCEIFNPARMDVLYPKLSPSKKLIICLRKLISADCVYFLPGWENSGGAVVEINFITCINHYRRKAGLNEIEIVFVGTEAAGKTLNGYNGLLKAIEAVEDELGC